MSNRIYIFTDSARRPANRKESIAMIFPSNTLLKIQEPLTGLQLIVLVVSQDNFAESTAINYGYVDTYPDERPLIHPITKRIKPTAIGDIDAWLAQRIDSDQLPSVLALNRLHLQLFDHYNDDLLSINRALYHAHSSENYEFDSAIHFVDEQAKIVKTSREIASSLFDGLAAQDLN